MVETQEELSGTVDHFIFQNQENGYAVFVLVTGNKKITVTGYVPNINPGEQITAHGAWIMHPKFGKQFTAQHVSSCLPTTTRGLKKYLGSGLIKGIGPIYAEKLVSHFGTKVLEIIDKQPSRLREVGGIGDKRLETIINAWADQKEISSIMVFLQEKGISTTYAIKIYKQYKQDAISVLKQNPYKLVDDIWGIGFKSADTIAQQMGLDNTSIHRIKAGIKYIISAAVGEGHVYISIDDVQHKTVKLLELANDRQIKQALQELYQEDQIKYIEQQDNHFITLSSYYFTEKTLAHNLLKLANHPSPHTFDSNAIYNTLRISSEKHISLNEDQQHGIMTCLQHKVTIITGGPGTGKTTLIKKLLTILDAHHIIYKLAAPTGRAAKRITESTGHYAMTLHRLLAFDASTMRFTYNEQHALPIDFLIVDEASMLDIFLAHALVKALPRTCHLILIGDVDQLPSVGPGNVLHNIIASKKFENIHLKEIFRQAENSMIIVNAHRINQGKFPASFSDNMKHDYLFIKEEHAEHVEQHLYTIFTRGIKKIGIQPQNTMVLTPMNRGIIGTQTLNHQLQQILNPTQQQYICHAGTTFKIGDRVMQIRNNYDKSVFNGDIGTIEEINSEDRTLIVLYDEQTISYDFTELDELVLAYAISIHKSQGSEFDAIIIPMFMNHFMLLQRNLLYTAITRAKQLCIVIGQPKAIAIAIKNNKVIERKTFLIDFLTTDLQAH